MSPRARILLAVGSLTLSLFASVAHAAAPFGYASAFRGLYRVDLATGESTLLGTYGSIGGSDVVDIEALAMMPDGTLFGVSDANKAMVRFAPGSSRASIVASLDPSLVGFASLDLGLAASCAGELFMSSDVQRKLWRLDASDGAVQLVADLPAAISGLTFRNGFLYGLAVASPGPEAQGLYRIDPATGAATRLGTITSSRSVQDAGLDFDADGRLWATFDYNPPSSGSQADFSDLAQLDPATGAVLSRTAISNVERFEDFEGLAIAAPVCTPDGNGALTVLPVPVSSRFGTVLLALGLLALGVLGARRYSLR